MASNKKIKVIFDNNQSIVGSNRSDQENIFSNDIFELKRFIIDNNIFKDVDICLTEVFRDEGIIELERRAIENYKDIKNKSLNFGYILNIKPVKELSSTDIKKKVQKVFKKKLKENNIKIIPLIKKFKLTDFYKIALNHEKPFEAGDKGFKDSLAWFSILEDASKNKNTDYILISNDGVFKNNTGDLKVKFKKDTGREISIRANSSSIEEDLDLIFSLGKNLKATKEEILRIIEDDSAFHSELEREALQDINKRNFKFSMSLNNEEDIVNLIYEKGSPEVNVKERLSEDDFSIEVDVNFLVKYANSDLTDQKKSEEEISLWSKFNQVQVLQPINVYGTNDTTRILRKYRPTKLTKKFHIKYNKKDRKFKITDIKNSSSFVYAW